MSVAHFIGYYDEFCWSQPRFKVAHHLHLRHLPNPRNVQPELVLRTTQFVSIVKSLSQLDPTDAV